MRDPHTVSHRDANRDTDGDCDCDHRSYSVTVRQ
jgi:hypothetical protein